MKLRGATPEDAPAAARLMEVLGYPTTAAAMRRRLEELCSYPEYLVLLAEADGEVRGIAAAHYQLFLEHDGGYVRLQALAVDEEWQAQGVGTALVREVESWATQLGAGAVILASGLRREAAHDFYRHLGYEATGLRFVKQL
ncbi:MAG: GNAT family N-acetyltransferase [Chloroflexota bacterium]